VFDGLEKEEILFTKDKPFGFIPLSANCFAINSNYLENEAKYQGRFYTSVVAKDIEEQNQFYSRLNKVFHEMGIIYK
jgi:hypothetical protein